MLPPWSSPSWPPPSKKWFITSPSNVPSSTLTPEAETETTTTESTFSVESSHESTTASAAASPVVAWDARNSHAVPHDGLYYTLCMYGGIIACGSTHTAMTPLDVIKCNMQANPTKYKTVWQAGRTILREEGVMRGLLKGWEPTFAGYSMQGAGKFGLYEVFKDAYSNVVGEDLSFRFRDLIYVAAAGSAELLADLLLCPMEMIKVKVQTSPKGTFPTSFGQAAAEMIRNSHETKFPLGSIVPLWGRQIPYTIAKFYFFEKIVELFYTYAFTKPKEMYDKPTQLGITFASGYLAGIVCAIVSHPADSLVSLLSTSAYQSKSMTQIVQEVGIVPLATKGLGPRIIMIGTLTGFQWWIYDSFKTMVGLGTTGGAAVKH